MMLFGPDVLKYTDYRKYLAAVLRMAKRKDRKFTVTDFATCLGLVHRVQVYLILERKRNLSQAAVMRMTKLCKLKKRSALYFEYLVLWQDTDSEILQNEYFKRMCRINPRLKSMAKKLNRKRRFGRKRK
jgi:uncharacterized protein (TIGR02147 family)